MTMRMAIGMSQPAGISLTLSEKGLNFYIGIDVSLDDRD